MRSKTHKDIAALLADGKARTANEVATELGMEWAKVSDAMKRMRENGVLIAAAGRAYKPANGFTARRYVLNREAA